MDFTQINKQAVFKRENVLIIGGAGFLGSHLCDQLIKNFNIICIDNFVTSSQSNISHLLRNPNFVFIRHDINHSIDLEEIPELQNFNIKIAGISQVYNLACPNSIKNFEKHKIPTLLSNSLGVYNSLELALKYKAKFLLGSSSIIYGNVEDGKFIFKEDFIGTVDHTNSRACYDEGKRFAETMALTYRDVYNLDVRIARIFRTYGPRMPLADGHMIPDFIISALDKKDLIIYGNETYTSSFCYVTDVVLGLVQLMKSDYEDPVNIGSQDNYLIKEVAEYIIGLLASPSQIRYEASLTHINHLGLPDISLAKDKINWFPVVTMTDGLQRTVEYTLANKNITEFKIG